MDYAQIAKDTKKDANNRDICLSPNAKLLRVKEFWRMVTKLEQCYPSRKVHCSSFFFKTVLLPKYITLSSRRLSNMFMWLSENWKPYGRPYPDIASFEEARSATSTSVPDTFEKDLAELTTKYPGIEEIFCEIQQTLTPPPANKGHSQTKLRAEMRKKGKVYSLKNRRWVDESDGERIGGAIVRP